MKSLPSLATAQTSYQLFRSQASASYPFSGPSKFEFKFEVLILIDSILKAITWQDNDLMRIGGGVLAGPETRLKATNLYEMLFYIFGEIMRLFFFQCKSH